MIQAQWRSLAWSIDESAAKLIKGSGIERAIKQEETETSQGQNPTNTKGFEQQTLSLNYMVGYPIGTDALIEWQAVQDELGKIGDLFIAGEKFGQANLMLTDAEFSAETINVDGKIITAHISITLTEDGEGETKAPKSGTKKKASAKEKTSKKTSGTPAEKTAYDVGPTKQEIISKLR